MGLDTKGRQAHRTLRRFDGIAGPPCPTRRHPTREIRNAVAKPCGRKHATQMIKATCGHMPTPRDRSPLRRRRAKARSTDSDARIRSDSRTQTRAKQQPAAPPETAQRQGGPRHRAQEAAPAAWCCDNGAPPAGRHPAASSRRNGQPLMQESTSSNARSIPYVSLTIAIADVADANTAIAADPDGAPRPMDRRQIAKVIERRSACRATSPAPTYAAATIRWCRRAAMGDRAMVGVMSWGQPTAWRGTDQQPVIGIRYPGTCASPSSICRATPTSTTRLGSALTRRHAVVSRRERGTEVFVLGIKSARHQLDMTNMALPAVRDMLRGW